MHALLLYYFSYGVVHAVQVVVLAPFSCLWYCWLH